MYARRLAEVMKMPDDFVETIGIAAAMHDVGKIGIPDAILLKPGKLTPAEWTEMRKHPEIGARMLQGINFLEGAISIVLSHQERFDGRGYPRRLKGEEIPLGARIFAVVDTLDAMTSDRPYRKAMTYQQAREEITRCRGTQFDPRVVDVFLQIPEAEWNSIHQRVLEEVSARGASRS
jgi:cyclic di-GMP phosphodiesterase